MYGDDFILAPIVMIIMGAIGSVIAYGLGWFVYGSVAGGLAIMLLCMVYGAVTVLAIIPFIGVFAQGYAILFVVWPAISEIVMIEATWLTTLIFVIYIVAGICYTFITTSMALGG